jgi:hypothetical protein
MSGKMAGTIFSNPMPAPRKVYPLARHIGALCVTNDTNVFKLGVAVGLDPLDLLSMINGRQAMPSKVAATLAKALDSDASYLEKLAQEVRADLV